MPTEARLLSKWIVVLGIVGLVIHGGTAILRVRRFVPTPELVDFAAFYVGASALREGRSPYGLDDEWVTSLRELKAIAFTPPRTYNPPIWLWMLQPLTVLSFPTAAWVWLALNLLALGWGALALRDISGHQGWLAWAVVFGLTVTFGPVFLDLTLGQTSVTLLVAALLAGRSLHPVLLSATSRLSGAVGHGLAAGAKLFPLAWMGALGLMRRWRSLLLSALVAFIVIGGGFVLLPNSAALDWQAALFRRVTSASDRVSMDDQSLSAWLLRLTQPQRYKVPGLRVREGVSVTWSPPWNVPERWVRGVGYGIAALLLVPVILTLVRVPPKAHEPAYYLWVLYPLVVLPHIARYNHTLLLPAIAWLWGRDGKARTWAVLAYTLAGLSRLNHLWLLLLPWPLAPLASGAGLWAVVVLGFGLIKALVDDVR